MAAQPISTTEFACLEALWRTGAASVRALHNDLSSQGKTWAFTTVQTLLRRMAAKGYVVVQREGRVLSYLAAQTRSEFLKEQLGALANRFCNGSKSPLMLSLVDESSLSKAEADHLCALIERLDAHSPPLPGPPTSALRGGPQC